MEALKLHWLGVPLIELKARTVKLETQKSVALVAYLSLQARPCARELVATLFWPEGSQQRALANLRRTLSSVNARLPGWIAADHGTISLKRHEKLWVDVDIFHRSLAQAREHCHSSSVLCDDCLSALTEAVGHCRGDFLEGLNLKECLNFDEWQSFERDGVRQDLGTALQRLTATHAARTEWEQAISCARRWTALDRLYEPACRALMDVYARSGQSAAALRQYEELARSLKELQGQEPEQETRQVYEQIVGQAVAKRVTQSPERSPSFPLLKAKLYIPTAPVPRVMRSCLVERLSEVEQKALAILSAPAGFGKTTLLAEWIGQTSMPVAWLSLDGDDNDPYRFLGYLVAALQGIDEELGVEAQQMLRSARLPAPHAVLSSLINSLGRVPESYVLILDDYQFIFERAVHETMAYLLDHLPPNMHVVIATRADPPLQLGRLRAHGAMLELRTQDLRFTPLEAIEFLNGVMRLGLSQEAARALEARTEGWVVGLKMAALSLKGHENADEFIRAFSGSHRFVLDYLAEEVLKRQPARIQTFLLETSILEKLNGPLCNALMTEEWEQSGEEAQAVLEYLERSNLFVIPLDDERAWYRYHHLFGDLLRSRLQSLAPERISALHARASAWFERNGSCAEALSHSITGGDFVHAASLVEQNARQLMTQTEFSFYLARLNAIPKDITAARPWLVLYRAWSYARLGRIREVEPLLAQVEGIIGEQPRNPDSNEMAGCIALIRANVANLQGNSRDGIEQTKKALDLLPTKNTLARDNVGFQRGFAYFANGDFSSARQEWLEVARSAMASQDIDTYANTAAELTALSKIEGELHQAYAICHNAHQWLKQQSSCLPTFLGCLEIGIAETLLEWGHLAEANGWNVEGIEHARAGGRPNTQCFGYCVGARLHLALNDLRGAQTSISEAENVLNEHSLYPRAAAETETIKVKLWIAQRKTGDITNWLLAHQADGAYAGDFLHELINTTRARALVATGEYQTALELLERLAEAAGKGGRNGRLVEMLCLQALAWSAQGDRGRAYGVLARSLRLAEPGGFIRLFLDEGEPMLQLLEGLRSSGSGAAPAEYLDLLLGFSRQPFS